MCDHPLFLSSEGRSLSLYLPIHQSCHLTWKQKLFMFKAKEVNINNSKKSFGIYTCYRQWVHIWKYNYFKVTRLYNTDLIFSSFTKNPQTKQTQFHSFTWALCLVPEMVSSWCILTADILGALTRKGLTFHYVDFHLISVYMLLCIL